MGGGPDAAKLAGQIEEALNSLSVTQEKAAVAVKARVDSANLPVAAGLLLPAVAKVRQAATRVTHLNNLKQLGRSFHSYASAHGGAFPPAVAFSADGRRPLLSWRVELLPYLDQEALYRQFRRHEPWDSPHNRALLSRMPRVFALPGQEASAGQTPYQVFVGRGALFQAREQNFRVGPRLAVSFPKGTSNTVVVAEAARLVPWTKPEDVPYVAGRPLKPLLGSRFGRFYVLLGDGSVRDLPPTLSESTLQAAVSPTSPQRLGPDWNR
jgi:hypothetical protein